LPTGVEEWSKALAQAVKPEASCPSAIKIRQKIAQQYDWDLLTHTIARTLCARMGREYEDELDEVFASNWTHQVIETL
jgi:hypothetical protein